MHRYYPIPTIALCARRYVASTGGWPLKGTDTGVIDSTKQQLAEVLQRVGAQAYAEAPASEGPTDGTSGNGAAPEGEAEGETIEGEYKEV